MSILVCGGAGYIGSHVVKYLLEKNEDVVVVDSLITGHVDAVDEKAHLELGDLKDEEFLNRVFEKYQIDGVIDFAAFSLVGESVSEPLKYFENNFYGTLCLLKVMKAHNVDKIVFSSTAATYGEAENMPILETDRTEPTNPYGESKLAVEKMFKWCANAYGLKYTALRYFNVAGAYPSGEIGEAHTCETHLIPLILQVALGQREKISIYGAHYLALNRLRNGGDSQVFNLGNGEGFSVKEVIEVTRKVTGHPIPAEVSPRRAGDPARLIASSQKALDTLKWVPKYDKLEQIIETAWNWHKNHPNGYED